MHDESSTFVRVEYLNKKNVMPIIQEAAKLMKRDPNVVSVQLFGSLVTGDYAPGSDADILVILKNDKRRMIDRIPEFLDFFSEVPIPVEVFPYTEKEIEHMKEAGNSFIREILDTALKLII